jgi:uncharacterized metal-binding protein YceD (DUF177 family)
LREIGRPQTAISQTYYLTARSEIASYGSCARLLQELRRSFETETTSGPDAPTVSETQFEQQEM